MQESKKHHYIPAFYLRKWERLEPVGKLIEFRKIDNGKVVEKDVSAEATGYEKCLYSIKTPDPGVLDHSFEADFFKGLDQDASVVLEQILSGNWPLNEKHKLAWAKYLYAQQLRLPEEMKESAERGKGAWEKLAQEDETIAEYLRERPEHERQRMDQENLKNAIIESKLMVPYFQSLRWRIKRLKRPKLPLLTSDKPLFYNNRMERPDGLMFMPLSPDTLFYAQNKRAPSHEILGKGSDNQIRRFCNQRITEQAQQYVWTNDIRQKVFIERRIGTKPQQSYNALASIAQKREYMDQA